MSNPQKEKPENLLLHPGKAPEGSNPADPLRPWATVTPVSPTQKDPDAFQEKPPSGFDFNPVPRADGTSRPGAGTVSAVTRFGQETDLPMGQTPLQKKDDIPTSPDAFKVPVVHGVPDVISQNPKVADPIPRYSNEPSRPNYVPDPDVAAYIKRSVLTPKKEQ